ncbi:MAG: hypothetical protein ACP6IP_05275 [Candidatus Njordarchaeia archaeon]
MVRVRFVPFSSFIGFLRGGDLDFDGDGLSDGWEISHGTNPLRVDSDGDFLVMTLRFAR